MGKPRQNGKRAETPGVSGPQGKDPLQQIKKPEKSSVPKKKKEEPSAGQQECSGVTTRDKTRRKPYHKNNQDCTKGSPDKVAGQGDNGGIGTAGLSSNVPVKIEEWEPKVEKRVGKGLSDDDHGEILVDYPSIGEVKEEQMSDAEVDEVVTEEGPGDFMMDDVSNDEELSSESVVNRIGSGSSSSGDEVPPPPPNEVEGDGISDSAKVRPVPFTEMGVSTEKDEETVSDDLIDQASNVAMEDDEANEDTEAAAVSKLVNEVVTEEGPGEFMMDDVSNDEELSSESVAVVSGIGSGTSSSSESEGFPPTSEIKEEQMSDADVDEVVTEDVSESVEEEKINDDFIDKASNAAMEVDDANQGTEAVAVSSITSEVKAQAIPQLLKQLAKKELLSCRLICKDWCETVDYYLENHPVYYPYRHDVTKEKNLRSLWEADLASSDNSPATRFPMPTSLINLAKEFGESRFYPYFAMPVPLKLKNWRCTRFQLMATLSNFRKEFEKSPRNPFVGRLVSLEPPAFGAPKYWKAAVGMASKLGKHIWILKIYTPGKDTGKFYEFYKGIQKFLKMVPELKYLEIQHKERYTRCDDVERNFINFANRNPLPNLPQLQTLVLPRSLENVLKMVLLQRYGAQVGKVLSDFHEWNGNAAFNLSELGLINVPSFESLSDKVFKPMRAVNLQKLELHFNVQDCVPVNQLFKGLQQFTSLKAVSIAFIPDCYEREPCKGCEQCSEYLPATLNRNSSKAPPPMILPLVESFKLATISPCLTFQFLMSLPQMKYFHLKCEVEHLLGITGIEEDIGVELKNLVYGKNTQLWKLIPSLKQVRINDHMEYNSPLVIRSKNPWISSFDKVIPHLFCELEYSDLLKLILVCPAWKGAIENFNDHQRIERPFNCSCFEEVQLARYYGLHHPKSIPCIRFTTTHDINKFKDYASENESGKDPFWLRSVSLEPTYDFRSNLFWSEFIDLLKMFGHHVWFLSLKVSTENMLILYRDLHLCLKNLPNLKSLEFDYADFHEKTEEAIRKVSQYIHENPLPTIEHLDTLCFLGNISFARKIVHALLLKYSGQLKRLDISPECWPINFGDLPKLVHLKLEVEVFYKRLPTLIWSLKAPNLQHLDLYLSKSIDQQFLFKLLEPFQLRSLCLYFMQMQMQKLSRSRKEPLNWYTDCKLLSPSDVGKHAYQHQQVDKRIITFPSVEQLDVRMCHDEQSLQFLRCFPSMKYLKFVKSTDARPDDDVGLELMKCRNGREAAKESKIWSMFPQLKEIQLIAKESTFGDQAGYFYISKRPIVKRKE